MAFSATRLWWCAWLAVAACCACLAITPPALAQNSAEKTAPSKQEQPSSKDAKGLAKNSAERAAKPNDTAAAETAGKADDAAAEDGPGGEEQPGATAPENAPPETAAPAGQDTEGAEDATAQPAVNTADKVPPIADPGAAAPPPAPTPGQTTTGANAAEARTAGGTAANAAEAGSKLNADGIAIPPEPSFSLPTPGESAGEIADYKPPQILLEIPGLDPLPDTLPPGSFNSPQRDYLDRRPLPGLDVDETEQERIARNIEESLKSIDLSVETRPEGGIQIPLPSGLVTFKAAEAFQFDRRNRILSFQGNVQIVFGDIAVWADKVEVNDSAATAYAKGYVAIQQRDEIIYADEAYINYDTKDLELFYIEGNTSSPHLQGRMYYEAQRAYGTFDRLVMEKAEVTTCDPFCGTMDEYHLSAHKLVFKRNTSVVLHDVFIYIRGHKVGYIPIIAMPLPRTQRYEQDESDVNQNYGYSDAEGFFAKFAYTYSTRYVDNVQAPLKGVIKLDMMQARGAGVGIRQDFYTNAFGVTTIRAYYQQDWPESVAQLLGRKSADAGKDVKFELDQELNINRYLTGSLKINRNNSFTPGTSLYSSGSRTNTWANTFNLAYQKNNTQVALSASQNLNIQGGYTLGDGTIAPTSETNSSNAKISINRNLGNGLKFSFDEVYTSSKGSSGREGLPADREGSITMLLEWNGSQMQSGNRAQGQRSRSNQNAQQGQAGSGSAGQQSQPAKSEEPKKNRWDGYNVRLSYKESAIDWDREKNTTDNKVTITKELPSLSITMPRDLFGESAYFNSFSLNLDNLVTGRRRDPTSIFRAKASIGGNDRFEFSRSSKLDTSLKFDQYWYDDGNAQYSIRPSINYSYDSFRWFKFDASWNYNFRQGVKEPPISSERTTISQSASYGFTFTNRRSWRGQLRGGYDIEGDKFNPVSMEFTWDPNKVFGLTATTSLNYQINSVNKLNDEGTSISVKRKRFKFNPLRVNGYLRSPYADPDGFYSWFFAWGITNDMEDGWRTTELTTRYYRKYERGWSSEIIGGYRQATDPPLAFDATTLRNYIKKVALRKTNCCTTFEGGWVPDGHLFYLNVYLNALPQYPGLIDVYRRTKTSAEGTKYLYEPDFLFPINPVINQIMQDQLGINMNTLGTGSFI